MISRLITITYFKLTGKYYTTASYISHLSLFDEICREVALLRETRSLPGLETTEIWEGYCLIDPEGGLRHLLHFEQCCSSCELGLMPLDNSTFLPCTVCGRDV